MFRRKHLPVVLFLLLTLLIVDPVSGQFYNGSQLTFGKSRVQYNDFFWTYYRYDKFDTYFYLNGKELAIFTAEYADKHIREIELTLQSSLDAKIQFIIFNNLSDLKQSNIGLYGDWEYYNTGGVTRIVGGKVMLYFDGDIHHFEQQIRAGITQVILTQMMYGSAIGAQIKNTALYTMPEWYLNGLISYLSKGWDTEIDNQMRDAVVNGRFRKFSRLTGNEAIIAGHSLWHFIAQKYGESAIPNVVYMSRLSRNIEKGFLYALNITFTGLVEEWKAYYQDLYRVSGSTRNDPQGNLLNTKNKPSRTYTQLKVSPDGNRVAYCTHELGIYKVFILDIRTGKKHRIYRGGYRIADRPDHSFPLLAWHPMGDVLAIMVERKGEPHLYFYDTGEKRSEFQVLYNFQKILDMSYSHDGSLLVFSAYQKGQSDIFTYNIASGSHEQITNDLWNDLNPRFINRSKDILFSSNRTSDTLRFYEDIDISKLKYNNDIFIYHYSSKKQLLDRITSTPMADETQPMPYSEGYIAYLSNQNGIRNRYLAKYDSTIAYIDTTTHYRYFTTAFPATNYNRSILQQDLSVPGGRIGEVFLNAGNIRMYVSEMLPPRELTAEKLEPTDYMERLHRASEMLQEKVKQDTLQTPKEEEVKQARSRFRAVTLAEAEDEIRIMHSGDTTLPATIRYRPSYALQTVDTVDLRARLEAPVRDTVNKYAKAQQLNYNVEFSVDQTVTQVDFNYLNSSYQPFSGASDPIFFNPGLNLLFMVSITDLMEDYRLTGGMRMNFDLVNNEYLLSYANYRRRLDQEIVFHRQGVDDYDFFSIIRHKINELHYIVTYPFNPVLNIRGTISARYDRAIYLSTDQLNLRRPDVHTVWGVLKGELTYDNTRTIGVNLYHGTRYKIFGEYYQLIDQGKNNVFTLGFDFRNYQKVHRSMIWANRLAVGTSFGSNKLLYYMGGVDNWLWPKFDIGTPVAIDGDYVFQTLATNMRGFEQNIRNGNSFLVLNSELRLPVFRYFINRPLRSDFLNSFQVVAFGDIGTAWTGATPYSADNQLFTYYIYRKPMFIKVEMLKDPLVGGFGAGLRTRILGYFIRGDVAWGVEDGRIRKPLFYLSLSLDF